jgi:hypothetical protein
VFVIGVAVGEKLLKLPASLTPCGLTVVPVAFTLKVTFTNGDDPLQALLQALKQTIGGLGLATDVTNCLILVVAFAQSAGGVSFTIPFPNK